MKRLLAALLVLLVLAGAGLAVFFTLFADEDGGATPLPGAVLDCQHAVPGELVACNEDRGVALTHVEEAYGPQGPQKVDQYFLIPLRVASVDDFRAKTSWAWKHWDVWRRENIDICEVKLAAEPNSLMLELSPEDLIPAQCR